MLTGDKAETAACIAISAGLKNKRQEIFEIRDKTNVFELKQILRDFEKIVKKSLLLIDGTSL